MHSISAKEWAAALFDDLDEALSRGATFPELMALLALEYELTSPIGRLAGRVKPG
ncbi:MAG: hypothetical protein ACLPLP_12155 [Mycobacterium sp.]